MAVIFSGTSQNLSRAVAVVSGYPCTLAAWVKTSAFGAHDNYVTVQDAAGNNYFGIGNNASGQALIICGATPTFTSKAVNAVMSQGNWHLVVGVFKSPTERIIYFDGLTDQATDAVAATPTGLADTVIASFLSAVNDWPGSAAYPAIWKVVLTPADILALWNGGQGVDPRTVRNDGLAEFWLLSGNGPWRGDVSKVDYTTTGAPTRVADPFSLTPAAYTPDLPAAAPPISVVQTFKDTAVSLTFTFASSVTAGNLLAAYIAYNDATSAFVSVTDSLGQTWKQGLIKQGNGLTGAIYYFPNTKAGPCTVTMVFSPVGPPSFMEVTTLEISGLDSLGSLDGSNSATAASGNADSGPVTTARGYSFLLAFVTTNSITSSGTPGWVFHQTTTDKDGIEYLIAPAAPGTFDATFINTGATVSGILAFRSAVPVTPGGLASTWDLLRSTIYPGSTDQWQLFDPNPALGGGGVFVIPTAPVVATTISPGGIAPSVLFGTAQLNQTIYPSGIAATVLFGTAQLNQTIFPSGIAPTVLFGVAQLNQTIFPNGIAPTVLFGTASLIQVISPAGIAPTVLFGTAQLNQTIFGIGLSPSVAFGTAQLNQTIFGIGIGPTLALGVPQLNQTILALGVAPSVLFGTAVVHDLGAVLAPLGIPPGTLFGNATLLQQAILTFIGERRLLYPEFPIPLDAEIFAAAETGTIFTCTATGQVIGVRFYRVDATQGNNIVSLWDISGNLLSTNSRQLILPGWQDILFVPAVIIPGLQYVASVYNPNGYIATAGLLASPRILGPLTGIAGVIDPIHKYPASQSPTDYWVSPIFNPIASSDGLLDLGES